MNYDRQEELDGRLSYLYITVEDEQFGTLGKPNIRNGKVRFVTHSSNITFIDYATPIGYLVSE